MTMNSYLAFILAATALAIVPGPTVTIVIANSLKHGTRAGLLNVLGTQIGVIIWLAIAALGLTAAIHMMGVWFDVLRYVGAAYLVWLGIKLFRSKGDLAMATDRARPHGSFLLQGFVVIMSNPKMLVLFGALIPPFIPSGADVTWSTLQLGLTFAVIACFSDSLYAILAGRAGKWLSQKRIRILEIISGSCLIGGAAWMVSRNS
ncbi:LysE family translocator [Aestuariivirga litoralis]|uniref:LysE family translocator n=1 Tax=Aestuariivirga litoralis TaxID=2650924 RepID=UPI0018C54B72|nr:LysE family translocator [Aestuariivirga litoralis]MBG1231722.1 LysE family translocator [Aestuariivirga litoralis]